MRNFTEQQALRLVNEAKGIEIKGKFIIRASNFEGFKGLTTCSAYDYLVNHCGYKG